jgi:hypothetical protein
MEFCKCGSIRVNGKCSNVHCPNNTQKHKDWVIDGRKMDFKKPVSYDDAAKLGKRLNMKDKNSSNL